MECGMTEAVPGGGGAGPAGLSLENLALDPAQIPAQATGGRQFRFFWLAQTFAEGGTSIAQLALPLIAAVALHATPLQMGLLTAAQTLPYLLFGLVAGRWVDRFSKHAVMIAADISRALLIACVPMLFYLDLLGIATLAAIGFLIGLAELGFTIASAASLPGLVGKAQLAGANRKLARSSSFAQTIGPAVAGSLLQTLGSAGALGVNALTYLLSAACLYGARQTDDKPVREDTVPVPLARADTLSGLRFVYGSTILRRASARLAGWQLVIGYMQALLILFLARDLLLSPTRIGVLLSVLGLGVVFSARIAGSLRWILGAGVLVIYAVLSASVAGMLIPITPDIHGYSFEMMEFALFVFALCATFYNINNVALRQMLAPHDMLGRMTASVRVFTLGLRPLGALAGGAIASATDLRHALYVAMVAGIAMSVAGVFALPLRKVGKPSDTGALAQTRF
jgi:MFS family permease